MSLTNTRCTCGAYVVVDADGNTLFCLKEISA